MVKFEICNLPGGLFDGRKVLDRRGSDSGKLGGVEQSYVPAGAVPEAAILDRASAQEADEDPTARGATSPQRSRDDGRASFWRKRRNEFFTHDIVEEHHTLLARWYELTDKYGLGYPQGGFLCNASRSWEPLVTSEAA